LSWILFYETTYFVNKYDLMFQISGLTTFHAGTYLCQGMFQSNIIIFTKIELEVHKPTRPTIFNNMTSISVVVKGKPLKMECHASGSPIPSVYWIREDNGMYHR